jgi:two-component system, LytTR family, sensor kinase
VPVTQATRRFGVAVLAWTAVGVLFALPAIVTGAHWRPNLLSSLAQWWSWGLVAPFIIAIDRRLPASDKQLARRILLQLLVSGPTTAAYVYVFAALQALAGVGSWQAVSNPQTILGALRGMFLWSWLVYWLIVGAWQAYRYHERYLSSERQMERLERRFTEARLNALSIAWTQHVVGHRRLQIGRCEDAAKATEALRPEASVNPELEHGVPTNNDARLRGHSKDGGVV